MINQQFYQPNLQNNNYQVQYNNNNNNHNNLIQNIQNQLYQQNLQNNNYQVQHNNKNNNLNNLNQLNNIQNFETKEKKNFDKYQYKEEAKIDQLKGEEDPLIGFDFSLLKRDELHVNLIHFDSNISNEENYYYYNKLKVDVVGGYIPTDSLPKFKVYLEALKKLNIPFIVLSSGFNGKDVIPICLNYPFIKEVIIFCGNISKYQYFLQKYPGYVKRVFNNIGNIYKYIKSFGPIYDQETKKFNKSDHFFFSPEDIEMENQLEQCPVISAYEYDNCYFLVHRAYAHFFRNDGQNITFTNDNFNKIQKYINNLDVSQKEKKKLINGFISLLDKQNFIELAIRLYTKETNFCYIFNRTMRNFEKGLISLAYYMGPFLYAINNYVKKNPHLGFNQDMTLYRNIICSEFDYYPYKMNLNHIICFPSITSTRTDKKPFKPTELSQKINNHKGNSQTLYKITMIFNYRHVPGNISPGILILNNKGKDNKYLSSHPKEKEVLLFPFTFAKIIGIKQVPTEENQLIIYFNIINRRELIENKLRDDVENRIRFSDMEKFN